MDTPARRFDNGFPAEQRIIGIELRYIDAYGSREEIALIPCDVRLPWTGNVAMRGRINATLHTSFGDINFPVDAELIA